MNTKVLPLVPSSVTAFVAPPLPFSVFIYGLFDNSASKPVALGCNYRNFKNSELACFSNQLKVLKNI